MSEPERTPRIFYGWYVLAASFAILFLNSGGRMIIGVMVKPMAADFGWSRGSVSSAIFLNLAVYALAVVVAGRLYDRYGPKWVIAGSTILFSAGYALMATMESLWQFLFFFGILAGIGLGGTTVPIFGSIMGSWFEKRRGMAVSLAMAGSCLGQFVLVPVFSEMIDGSGWRSTSLWIALVCLVANLALAFGVIRGGPAKFGVRAYGRAEPDRPRSGEPASPAPPRAPAGPRDLTLSEAMRTRSLWLFTLVMFVCGSGDFFMTTHLVPLVTDFGLSTDVGASMLAWFGLLGLIGVLLAGPAADTIGNKIPIALTFALRVALLLMVIWLQGAMPYWVLSLAFGFTLLITAPLTTTLVGALYGVTHIGFISGFINTVHMVGGGLWAYLGGVIYDCGGDYQLAFVVLGAMSAAAFFCALLIREERHLPPDRT